MKRLRAHREFDPLRQAQGRPGNKCAKQVVDRSRKLAEAEPAQVSGCRHRQPRSSDDEAS
jgi:hypothetical protein